MPTVIPYNPSLVLGNIVHPEALANILKISQLQSPIDNAQDYMNSMIATKLSLEMTIQEMLNMNVDPGNLINSVNEVSKEIVDAAQNYAKTKVDNEKQIRSLASNNQLVNSSLESPIDYVTTQTKMMPLAADSIKLDYQYFAYDVNEQESQNTISKLRAYVSQSFDIAGNTQQTQAANTAARQVNNQRQNHDIAGTLIISATCTHQNALLLAPLIINVDKAIRVWNNFFPKQEDKIKIGDINNMSKIAREEGTNKEQFLNIISGVTYGSCFVAMVHILNDTSTYSGQATTANKSAIDVQTSTGGGSGTSSALPDLLNAFKSKIEAAAWFGNATGESSMESDLANDIKKLFSENSITAHANMITMGVIPAIKAHNLKYAIKQFADFDPVKTMNSLATIVDGNDSDSDTTTDTVASGAQKAIKANQMANFSGKNLATTLTTLSDLENDEMQNKVIDVGVVMDAFDSYIEKIAQGDGDKPVGVPINYYIKPISRAQLAQMWMSKYYPGRYLSLSGDDSQSSNSGTNSNSDSTQ